MAKMFTFEVVEYIAVLGKSGSTTKELNRVSFAGAEPKYDIRAWQHDGEGVKPLKGITLTDAEASALKTALNARQEIPDLNARRLLNRFRR